MIVLLMAALTSGILIALLPRSALWLALSLPALQAFYSPPLLRVFAFVVLVAGLALGWRGASGRARAVAILLWLGTIVTLLVGWIFAPDPSLAEGIVVNVLFSSMTASLASVFRMSAREWNAYLLGWGLLVSFWLISNDVVVTGRTGSLYLNENANALGMFGALGFVGAIGLANSQGTPAIRYAVGLPAGAVCALGVISSGSRGALLVATAGAVVQMCSHALRQSGVRALAVTAGLFLATVWVAVPTLTWFLSQSGRQISATTNLGGRESILRSALDAGVDHPLSGVGFGALRADDVGIAGYISSHNAYVGLFAAAGVVPLLLLLALIARAVRSARTTNSENFLPLVAAVLCVGISLDWVPTAKLGPVVLGVLACVAALGSRGGASTDSSKPDSLGENERRTPRWVTTHAAGRDRER